MSKYIDVEWLKQNFNTTFWSQITKTIDSAPSIDIVRCRECKHWRNDGFCTHPLYSIEYQYMRADDFCSYGERSEKPNNCEDEQTTQTETQNSNLTFEKVMEEIQTQVIEFPDTHQKFTFARKIEMDGDSIKIGGWEYKGVKDGEREGE